MITAQNIKDELIAQLGAKEYKSYLSSSSILQIIRATMQANGLMDESTNMWTRDNKQQITLVYKQHTIGIIAVKKSKGDHHYKWGESWYDWYYKDFNVNLYKDSLEDCLQMVEEQIIAEEQAKDTKKAEALDAMKVLMDHTGIESTYGIACLCEYIFRHRYELSEALENA